VNLQQARRGDHCGHDCCLDRISKENPQHILPLPLAAIATTTSGLLLPGLLPGAPSPEEPALWTVLLDHQHHPKLPSGFPRPLLDAAAAPPMYESMFVGPTFTRFYWLQVKLSNKQGNPPRSPQLNGTHLLCAASCAQPRRWCLMSVFASVCHMHNRADGRVLRDYVVLSLTSRANVTFAFVSLEWKWR